MFQITLEGKQVKRNQVTGMHLMAGFLLIVMGIVTWLVPNAVKSQEFNFLNYLGLTYSLIGLAILIICIIFNKKVIQTQANFTLRIIEIAVFIPILIYSLIQKWYLPAGYSGAALLGIILAYYWEKSGKQTKTAIVDETGIQIKGIGKNNLIVWHDIKHILLRHNILTIDCENNKLFQYTTLPDTKIDKWEFEQFCIQKIKETKHLYKADWL